MILERRTAGLDKAGRPIGIPVEQLMPPQEFLSKRHRMLFLYGPITLLDQSGVRNDWYSPAMLCDGLLTLASTSDEPIVMMVESNGGVVDSALCIVDTMRSVGVTVRTVCRQAASAATLIVAAGEPGERYIYPNARMLIHQPAANLGAGTATDHKKQARELMKVYRKLGKLYKQLGATPSVEKIMADMKRETWLDADEAIAYGLVDKIVPKGLFG